MKVNVDCRFFRGDVPCRPHKEEGVHCEGCRYYRPLKERILIIKLGAMGDVIRTTPLLRKLREVYPDSEISWLTNYPEVVPPDVDRVYGFTLENVVTLLATTFDILYSLDKDRHVSSLATMLRARVKKGFHLEAGKCSPIDGDAGHKWLTGLFDDVSKSNAKSYPEEIFEICGFPWNGEEYILGDMVDGDFAGGLKKQDFLIGLNTGCGGRWKTRLWPDEYWVELARRLAAGNADVIFMGGPAEHQRNKRLADLAGCAYPGHFPLSGFISVVNQCDLVVTGVTMALHIAVGLRKKIVLLNNIFNRNEFELYGLGTIIEPELDCLCCYKTSCETECMRLITPDRVFEACTDLLRPEKKVLKPRVSVIFPKSEAGRAVLERKEGQVFEHKEGQTWE